MEEKKLSKSETNGSSSCRCYKIEVCASYDKAVGKFVFTKDWKTFSDFSNAPNGVPGGGISNEASRSGFFSYHQAKALEHWLHAELQYSVPGLKTRLAEYLGEFTHKFTLTGKGSEPIDQLWPTLKEFQ